MTRPATMNMNQHPHQNRNRNRNAKTSMLRRRLIAFAAGCVGLGAVALSGCSTSPPVDPGVRQVLAPGGAVRIGVYAGSPTPMVGDAKTGEKIGLALNFGFRILHGRWGEENLAIAIPKGREADMAFVRQFAQVAQSSGLVRAIAAQVGLRGVVRAA